MADSVYALYVPPNTPSIAGKARSRTARRDKWGRFLPNVGELPLPVNHGRAGGLVRGRTGKKNNKGRFTK